MAARGSRSLRYALVSTAEEALELAGVIVCAYALLLLLGARGVTVELREDGGRGFEPLPRRGPAVSNELIDRLREDEPE